MVFIIAKVRVHPVYNVGMEATEQTLILLDRNAVTFIRDYLSAREKRRTRAFLNARSDNYGRLFSLHSVDRPEFCASPLLSIMEGQLAGPQTAPAVVAVAEEEFAAVAQFFTLANTDGKVGRNAQFIQQSAAAFSGELEHSFSAVQRFLTDCFPLIYQSISADKRLSVENTLFELARKHTLSISHPAFIVAVASLYGNRDCQAVLKPKASLSGDRLNRATYNSTSDIAVLHRVAMITALLQSEPDRGPNKVRFFTFDKPLLRIYDSLEISGIHVQEGKRSSRTTMKISFSADLFPNLPECERPRLQARLGLTPSP